jgi:hypothetical protein
MSRKAYWIAQDVKGTKDQVPTGNFWIYEQAIDQLDVHHGIQTAHLGKLLSIPGAGMFARLEAGAYRTRQEAEDALAKGVPFEGERSIYDYPSLLPHNNAADD